MGFAPSKPGPTTRSTLPFGLSFVEGKGVVTLTQRSAAGPLALDSLALEIPNIKFPFDVSGGARTFRHRRCQLREATLTCEERALGRWLGERAATSDYGYRDLGLRFTHDAFEISGRLAIGADRADFLFRGIVQPVSARAVIVGLCDLLLFDAFPVPAPMLAGGLLRAFGAVRASEADELVPAVRIVGCTDVVLDPLALLLFDTLPAHGWRLPNHKGVRLERVTIAPGRLQLGYGPQHGAGGDTARSPLLTPRLVAIQEGKNLFADVERRLLDDDTGAVLDLYRRHHDKHPDHPFLLERLLQLTSASPRHDDETLRLAQQAQEALGDFAPALLAAAAVHGRREEPLEAAARLRRVADLAADARQPAVELRAALAAGRHALSEDLGAARADFERALGLERDHPGALRSLGRIYAELGEWQALAQIRERQIALASSGEQRMHGHLALGELLRVHLCRPERAREQYELALEQDPDCEPALRGLAEACIDGDDPLRAVHALDRLCGIAARRDETDSEVAIHLRIASLWEHLGHHQNALARLQRARQLRPRDSQALRRTALLLMAIGRHEDAVLPLQQLLQLLHDPTEQLRIHQYLAELCLVHLDDVDEARAQLDAALAIDPQDEETLRLRVELAEQEGRPELLLAALDDAAAAQRQPTQRALLLLRRGQLLAAHSDDREEAKRALSQAVDHAPDGGWAALRELALLHEREDAPELALDAWRKALANEAARDDDEGWLHLGLLLVSQAQWADARTALERALAGADAEQLDRAAALEAVAECYAELELPDERRTALEQLLPLLDATEHPRRRAAALAALGELRERAGDFAAATAALEEAAKTCPDDPVLLETLADLHESQGAGDQARDALRRALELHEGDEDRGERGRLALRIGDAAAAQGDIPAAIAAYRRALAEPLDPRQSEGAWRRIVDLQLRQGDATAAAHAAEAAAATAADPSRRARWHFAAGELWRKRVAREDEAIRCFERALAAEPHHRQSLDALESIAQRDDDIERLCQVLQSKVQAAAAQPKVQKALLVRLAEAATRQGDDEGARAACATALGLDEQYLPALLFLARDAWRAERKPEAERLYQQVIDALLHAPGPADVRQGIQVEARLRLASGAAARGDGCAEEGHLEAALAADPSNRRALERLDELFGAQLRFVEQAEIAGRRAAGATALADKTRHKLRQAQLLRQAGRIDDAIAALRAVLLLDPAHDEALAELAQLLRQQGRSASAIELLREQLASAEPAGATPWLLLAELAVDAGDDALAIEALERAGERDPEDPRAVDLLLTLARQGRVDHDIELLLRRRLEDRSAPPESRRAWLRELVLRCERRGGHGDAAALLQRAVDEEWADASCRLRLATVLQRLRRWQDAAALLQQLTTAAAPAVTDRLRSEAARELLRLARGPLDSWERIEPLADALLEQGHELAARAALIDLHERRGAWDELAGELATLVQSAALSRGERLDMALLEARALAHAGRASAAELVLRQTLETNDDERAPEMVMDLAGELGCESCELLAAERLATRAGDARSDAALAARRRAAQIYQQRGDEERALDLLLELLERAGGEQLTAAANQLLDLTRGEEHAPARLRALRALEAADAATPAQLWELARALADDGDPQQALGLLQRLPPAAVDGEAHRELCWRLHAELHDFEALAAAKQQHALAQPTPHRQVEGLLAAAECWLEKVGRADKAAECVRDAAAAAPSNLQLVERAAGLFAARGAWQAAIALLDELALPDRPVSPTVQAEILCRSAELRRRAQRGSDEEERALLTALERDPRSRNALGALDRLYGQRGDYERQQQTLQRLAEVSDGPEQVDALLRAAELLVSRLDRGGEGVALLRRARELSPDPALLEATVRLQVEMGNLEAAEEALLTLADTDREPEIALQRACGLAHLRGDADAEARYLARLALLKPEDPALSRRLLEAFRAAGDLEGLRSSLEELAAHDRQALAELAELLAGPLDDPAAARDAYARLLAEQADDPRALEGMIDVCRRLDRHDELAQHFERLIALQPPDAAGRRGELLIELGRCQLARGDREAAKVAWRSALVDLAGGKRWAAAQRLLLAIATDDERLALLRELFERNEASDEEVAELAASARAAGEKATAIDALRALQRDDPLHAAAGELVQLLRETGEAADAADLLERQAATASSRGDAVRAGELLLELAACCADIGQPRRAEAALRRALDVLPERASAALVAHHRGQGDEQALAAALEQALPHTPPDRRPQLLDELISLHEQLQQPERCAAARRQLFALCPDRDDLVLPLLHRSLARRDLDSARAFFERAHERALLDAAEEADTSALLGELELEHENATAAREALEQALKRQPRHAAALRTLRKLALWTDDPALLARAHLALADVDHAQARVAHLNKAAAALARIARRREAIALYRQILDEVPNDQQAADDLERLLRLDDDPGPLADLLWWRVEREPDVDRLRELARLERERGREDRVERATREALRLAPQDGQLLLDLAHRLRERGRWRTLHELLERHLHAADLDSARWAELATLQGTTYLDHIGDEAAAIEWLETACARAPVTDAAAEAHRRLAALWRRRGDAERLEALLRARLAVLPAGRRAPLHRELGEVLSRHPTKLAAAADAFAAAWRERPDDASLVQRAHQLYLRCGKKQEATALLDEALERLGSGSERAVLLTTRARLLDTTDREQAIADLRQALRLDPDQSAAQAELGRLLLLDGAVDEALPLLQAAADRQVDPKRKAATAMLAARALEQREMLDEALRRYEQAAESDPSLRDAWEALVQHHERLGQHEPRLRALSALAALTEPGARRGAIWRQLADLHRNLGQPEAAYGYYQRALEENHADIAALRSLRRLAEALDEWRFCAELLRWELELVQDPEPRARVHRELAMVLAERMQLPNEAIEELQAAIELDPTDIASYRQLMPLFTTCGRHGDAGRVAQQLSEHAPPSERRELLLQAAKSFEREQWLEEARMLYVQLSEGEDEAARQAADRLLELAIVRPATGPTRPRVRTGTVELTPLAPLVERTQRKEIARITALHDLVADGAWDEVAALLRERIESSDDPQETARLQLRLASVLDEKLELGAEALELYESAAALLPDDTEVLEACADAAYRYQQWHRAREIYDRLWQRDCSLPATEVAFRRGVIHEALGYESVADRCYAETLAADPHHRAALEARSRLALVRDDTATAIDTLTALSRLISVDEQANLAELRQSLGELHLRRGNVHTAREYLEAVLAFDSRRQKAMQLLLAAYEQLGEYAAAAKLSQDLQARLGDPLVRASLLHHRAELLASHLDDEEEAINCLLRAYDVTSAHIPTLWRLVDYYWNEGDLESVHQMGCDLEAAGALRAPCADLRLAYLAAATFAMAADPERAADLLRSVLRDPALTVSTLLELANAVAIGCDAAGLAGLVRRADDDGTARQNALQVLRDNPRHPCLEPLVSALLAHPADV